MAQVKTNYSTGTPLLQQDDVVYLVDLSPCGTHVQHHAINMISKELSVYACRTNGDFLFRKVTGNHTQRNYRGGFHRLAVSVSAIAFALMLGLALIGIADEGVGNLTVQNVLIILVILAGTVAVPMGIYKGLSWIVAGFKPT